MRSLYLRIYLTLLATLALFALGSGWLLQRHLEEQRVQAEQAVRERVEAWGEMLQRSLPGPQASRDEQAQGLREWSQRLRLPMALDDAQGQRIAASDSFARRELESPEMASRLRAIRFDDGRTLWVPRLSRARGLSGGRDGEGRSGETRGLEGRSTEMRGPEGRGGDMRAPDPRAHWWTLARGGLDGSGLIVVLLLLFLAVAVGAWPVVRSLTRRLELLKQGVEAFGAGALHQRVAEDGRDEVAAVGASFNRAASRVEALLRSHQSLLANASHELRSPLARLKMALALLEVAQPEQRAALRGEIATNIAELDALVEEVLLASRLDSATPLDMNPSVGLLALAAEEASRVGAEADGDDLSVRGDERLLRRALRNLLENARRYGGAEVSVTVIGAGNQVRIEVCDRGPGVPEAYRERIFEAFFRMPGHAERAGGVGLGLSLVRQIALRHDGQVLCLPRPGGGSCFVLILPRA